jgi:hypothetical protein
MSGAPTPPIEVLRAFGVARDTALPLPGGQGHSFVADGLVLKRIASAAEARWSADLLASVAPSDAVRVAAPVRSATGDWVHDHWTAFRWVDGDPVRGRR